MNKYAFPIIVGALAYVVGNVIYDKLKASGTI